LSLNLFFCFASFDHSIGTRIGPQQLCLSPDLFYFVYFYGLIGAASWLTVALLVTGPLLLLDLF